MLGRLPWLAFERRMRAFFFLVFFDMKDHPTCALALLHRGAPTAAAAMGRATRPGG